jgi:transcription antitermination protein NusB
MNPRRTIRMLAMQVLYQLDLRGEADAPAVRQSLEDQDEATPQARQEAFDLAMAAWSNAPAAGALAAELAPDWPVYRQPPLDKAILRLAHFEMASGRVPVKVAINEAVELAKRFCSQQSPAFINAVLDKIARKLPPPPDSPPEATPEASPSQPPPEGEGKNPSPPESSQESPPEATPEVSPSQPPPEGEGKDPPAKGHEI